jgi:V8-like Glu-specific endopeptidase
MRKNLLALVVAALVVLGLQAPAVASTQGNTDYAHHPTVGFLLFYSGGDRYSCSGTLVSPTVVLTAGHCTDGTSGQTLVTFDSFIDDASPLKYDKAHDPDAGYTAEEISGMGAYAGTAYTDPDYSNFTDMDNWNDVGVIVLDEPIPAELITPAKVAGVGTLDDIKKSDLSKTLFTAVGYGTEVRKADTGPQKPTPMSYPLVRRFVEMYGQKLTPQILQTNGSTTNGKDTGTTCFGDSGGPVFYRGEVVAVTSYGNNDVCRGVSGYQRVDIAAAQGWILGEHPEDDS